MKAILKAQRSVNGDGTILVLPHNDAAWLPDTELDVFLPAVVPATSAAEHMHTSPRSSVIVEKNDNGLVTVIGHDRFHDTTIIHMTKADAVKLAMHLLGAAK